MVVGEGDRGARREGLSWAENVRGYLLVLAYVLVQPIRDLPRTCSEAEITATASKACTSVQSDPRAAHDSGA